MNALAAAIRFTDDAQGLEKTLRLLQSLCTIVIGLYGYTAFGSKDSSGLVPWTVARGHLLLARRYFRLFKWHLCWTAAYGALQRDQAASRKMIEVLKWTLLGAYFFLEMFVITNAMGFTTFNWGPRLQDEANKNWFYALFVSIVLSLYDLLVLWMTAPVTTSAGSEGKEKSSAPSKEIGKPHRSQPDLTDSRARAWKQLVIDSCELFIPGSALGWTPVDALVVGTGSAISTMLAGRDIWLRVNPVAA